MRPSTDAMAVLAVDSYVDPRSRGDDETIKIDGHRFRAIKHFNEPSGYQGTVYQDEVTGGLVLAHRGTEFDRQLLKDGIVTDGGMVLIGRNTQVDDAMLATAWALKLAENLGDGCGEIPLTVTGHSLGGTLAQITAYRYGLRGETFDAYGAAGLTTDMREGGNQIINHVRATDFVSAASRHVGEVRVYAAEKDLRALESAGYANDDRRFTDLRNPLAVVAGVGVEAHYSRNFLADNDLAIGGSIVSAENAARYEQRKPMIDKYRADVAAMHNTLALPRNIVDGVVDGARNVFTGREMQEQAAALRQTACATPAPFDARNPAHPDNALYTQIHEGMRGVDASLGRVPDIATDRASARLFAEAKAGGITRADHVLMSTGGDAHATSQNLFVVQGALKDPAHLRVQVSSAEAVATPVEQSFERVADQGRDQARQQQLLPMRQHEQDGPRHSM
jgi:pimeloyl-ACP methyl ester carboxylesterase